MVQILFGSKIKVVYWAFFVFFVLLSFQHPVGLLVALLWLLAGPGVAIPAMIAVRGKEVLTARSERELKTAIVTIFAAKKMGRKWVQVTPPEDGKMEFKLTSTVSGREPVISLDWEEMPDGLGVRIWMSHWWEANSFAGVFDGGRGTPFWVFGGSRALSKINEVAQAIETPPASQVAHEPTAGMSVSEGSRQTPDSAKISESQPTLPRSPIPPALTADSFTWVASWRWTTKVYNPGQWSSSTMDEFLDIGANGLCSATGSSVSVASETCEFGLVHTPSRAVYLTYQWLGSNLEELEIVIADGGERVGLATIPGVQLLKFDFDTHRCSATVSPDGKALAVNYRMNQNRYISLIDTCTGIERPLTRFDNQHGDADRIAFSPDGRWLLATDREGGVLVIDATTGAQRAFPEIRHGCWWVHEGHLGLISIGVGDFGGPEPDPSVLTFLDLTTGDTVPLVRITPPSFCFDPPLLERAEPHADGRVLLSMLRHLPLDGYDRCRTLAILDLKTGGVEQVIEPLADQTGYVLRGQKEWHWNSPLDLTLDAHPAVLDQGFSEVDMSAWPQASDEHEYGVLLRVAFDSPFLTGQL